MADKIRKIPCAPLWAYSSDPTEHSTSCYRCSNATGEVVTKFEVEFVAASCKLRRAYHTQELQSRLHRGSSKPEKLLEAVGQAKRSSGVSMRTERALGKIHYEMRT